MGAIGWSLARELAQHATPDDEEELLESVRGMSVRQVRAALREPGAVDEEEEEQHRCCSPACDSRVCTNHHVRYRSQGGTDEAENQITGCDFCHLDGEHGGRLKVRGTASELVWVLGRTPILRVEGRTKIAA